MNLHARGAWIRISQTLGLPTLVAVLFAAVASVALAQQPAAPPADQAKTEPAEEQPQETLKEEITVTSRLREETLQEIPFSIVAPTEVTLRERGVTDMEGIAANVPGFTVQNLGPGQSQVAMRGVSAGQIVRDQPGVKEQVGIYLDDSAISTSLFTPDIDLWDLSRVEVLRGPQGTLFGSGSLSGTVRYITNAPELGATNGNAEMTLSSITGGGIGGSAKATMNRPLGDKGAMRVAAYYTQYGGFIDAVQPNLSVNEDVNDGHRAGARLSFRFDPNERFSITPRLVYQKIETNGWNRTDLYNILGNPFTTTRPPVRLGDRRQFTQIEEPYDDEFLLADVNATFDFGGFKLTSITTYIDRDVLVVRDAGALTSSITGGSIGLPARVYTLDSPLNDATQVKSTAQELRLFGATDKLDWLVGVFYNKVKRDYAQRLIVTGFETLSGIPTRGLRAPKDVLFYSDLSYDFKQFAVFGEATYHATDRLDLSAGLRSYDFTEDRDQVFDGIFGNDDNGRLLVSQPGKTDANGLAPRAIASFKASDTTTVNAVVSRGFRLGGINDPLNVPLCTPDDLRTFGGRATWKDEKAWNYEVGSKSTIMGGRGTFNASAFIMDIEDLQATVTAGSCSSRVVFNVPKASSQGVELEFAAAPTQMFDFALSASFNDSQLDSTLTSTDSRGTVSVVSGIKKGNRLPTVPEFQAAAALNYHWNMGTERLGYFTAIYQYTGSRFTQVGDQAAGFGIVNLRSFNPNNIGGPYTQNTFTFDPELPAYDNVNLRVGMFKDKWDVALFVNNATDEEARLALDQERGTRARVGYLTNQPRTFGVTTRLNF
jgi:iron complex outermembrane receptor protein